MNRSSGFVTVLIVLVTLVSLLINIPSTITLPFNVPFINKNELRLVNLNTFLNPIGLGRDFSFRKGLDLEGGSSITLRADMSDIPQSQRENALESAKEVIERRINFFGVTEPLVQTASGNNDYRIIVEIPGVTDVNQAASLIGTTAELSFWEEGTTSASLTATESAGLPLGVPQMLGPDAKKTELTGKDLESAAVTFNPNTGEPQVQLNFTSEGAKKFADITKRNVGKIVGIVLDNELIQAPRVNEPILAGTAEITGGFTLDQAKAVQIQLNAGALPVPLSMLEQKAIGATLGNESLQKSFMAGFLGFGVIVAFMIALYGRLGVVASLALTVYTLVILALFRIFSVTLTLAGIAGLILSIGIAVDANILIFERVREEVRRGRTYHGALNLGFTKAWASIRDSNIASLITSAILMIFGSGMVRGFALTLAIGVVVSLFSAITVTRTLLGIMYKE